MKGYYRGVVDIDGPPFPTIESPPPPDCATLPAVIRPVECPADGAGTDVPKRSKDRETIRMVRTLNGLAPCTAYDSERLSQYGFGHEIDVTIWQERSVPHHRLYWVLLATLVSNSEGKYLQSTDLHEAIKVALGVTRKIKLLTPSTHASVATRIKVRLAQCLMWIGGLLANVPMASKITGAITDSIADLAELEKDCDTITMPGSTGFQTMDQAAFKIYFEQACAQLRTAGYPVDEAIAESKKMMQARVKPMGPAHQPYHPERDHVLQQTTHPEPAPREIDHHDHADRDRAFQERGGTPESPF